MEIRPLRGEERKYTYAQSMQIEGQTGSIGHLRGDFGKSGLEFHTTWSDHRKQLNTDEFKAEFDDVINALRSDEYALLKDLSSMRAFGGRESKSAFMGNYCTEYGFRVETDKHAFLLRCSPSKGDYNVYCFCYVSEWLDKHIEKASKGIRFIDPNYKELFRLADGGKITLTAAWGEKSEHTCRYIDETHLEVGSNLYHICEFAERMEKNGATYEPKQPQPAKAPKNKDYER